MGSKKSTQKQFVIIVIVALFVCVELSGCNQISNIFLTDEDKLVGTWNSDGIWLDVPTVLVFYSNGTFKIDLGIPNSPIDFSLSEGKWNMKDGVLMMEIVDLIPPSNYTYKFSEDSRTIEITDIGSSDSYILRKQ
jgi:hypothetical protein